MWLVRLTLVSVLMTLELKDGFIFYLQPVRTTLSTTLSNDSQTCALCYSRLEEMWTYPLMVKVVYYWINVLIFLKLYINFFYRVIGWRKHQRCFSTIRSAACGGLHMIAWWQHCLCPLCFVGSSSIASPSWASLGCCSSSLAFFSPLTSKLVFCRKFHMDVAHSSWL